MSRTWWWILVLGIGIMGGIALWRHAQRPMAAYTTFTSQHLQARFDYPAGWRVEEITVPMDRVLGEVQIFGPRREDLQYSLYVDVAAETIAGDQQPIDLEAAVQAALAELQRQPSYAVLDRKEIRCAGGPAVRVMANYDLILPLNAANRKPVKFTQLTAFRLRGDRLFRLTYAAPAEDFPQHQHAFDRLVKTFAFLQS